MKSSKRTLDTPGRPKSIFRLSDIETPLYNVRWNLALERCSKCSNPLCRSFFKDGATDCKYDFTLEFRHACRPAGAQDSRQEDNTSKSSSDKGISSERTNSTARPQSLMSPSN